MEMLLESPPNVENMHTSLISRLWHADPAFPMQNAQLVLGLLHSVGLWAWGCGKQVKNHQKTFVIMRQRCDINQYAVSVSVSVVSNLFRFVRNPLLFVAILGFCL